MVDDAVRRILDTPAGATWRRVDLHLLGRPSLGRRVTAVVVPRFVTRGRPPVLDQPERCGGPPDPLRPGAG